MEDTKTFGEMYELNIEEYETIDIDSVEFSVRVNNRLHREKINSVAALLRCTPKYLADLKGFGAGCFKEIHDYCKILQSKNEQVNANVQKKRVIPQSIYEHRNQIICGDFSCLIDNAEEKKVLLEYKEGFNTLGVDLVKECIENPYYARMLVKMFEQFMKSSLIANKLIHSIPANIRKKKAKLLIEVFTNDVIARAKLLDIIQDEDETVEDYIKRNERELLSAGSFVTLFAQECSYNLYEMIDIFFNEISKNERAYEIVKLRAEGQTLEQVGNGFSVTRERIRQIEKKVSKKFINWLNHYAVLQKIVAEQDGNRVIFPSAIFRYFHEYAYLVVHFLKVYEDEIDNFMYDKSVDVFIVGNAEIIMDVQAYVDELPSHFNEKELEDILRKSYEYPIELTRRIIEIDYNKTGDVYHRSRLTLGKVYADILSKYYEDGIWVYSDLELKGFVKHVLEDYGDIKLPESNRAIVARIASVGLLYGRGTYGPKKEQYISEELANQIHTYICESDSPIFLTNTIYNVFEEQLKREGVSNKYYLQGILHELYKDEFVFRRDYVSKDGNLTSVYSEIVNFIEKSLYPVTKQQIVEAFPGVTEIVINISITDPDIINLFGVYIHSNKLRLEKIDIDYIKTSIDILTKKTDFIHCKNLFEYIQRDNPTLLGNNGIYQAFGLFSVVEFLFKDIMEFSRPYIGKKGAVITRTFDQLHEMVEESDVIALSDIISVARDNHFQITSILEFANSCNNTHLLINDKELANIEYTGIDKEIAMQIEECIINEITGTMYISDILCTHKFKKVNVPWTNWLIYSIILKWSTQLDVSVTSNTFRQAQPIISLKGKLEMDEVEYKTNISDVYVPDNLDNIDDLISDIIMDEIEV